MTNSSTVEGEHTIQGQDEDDIDDEETLDGVQEVELQQQSSSSPDVVETYSTNLRPNEDEIQLLRLKLEEAQCKNRVIQEEMTNLKAKLLVDKREQAVGSSDPEDETTGSNGVAETDQEKAKHLADQEVSRFLFLLLLLLLKAFFMATCPSSSRGPQMLPADEVVDSAACGKICVVFRSCSLARAFL